MLDSDQMDASDSDKENIETTETDEMDTGDDSSAVYAERLLHLVELFKSLNLLHFFADYAVADIIRMRVINFDSIG